MGQLVSSQFFVQDQAGRGIRKCRYIGGPLYHNANWRTPAPTHVNVSINGPTWSYHPEELKVTRYLGIHISSYLCYLCTKGSVN